MLPETESLKPAEKRALRDALLQKFDLAGLRSLCFELGLHLDDLPGETRRTKAEELILHCQRTNTLPNLRQRLADTPDLPAHTPLPYDPTILPERGPLPPGSRMIMRPNAYFVGREAELLALADSLHMGQPAVIHEALSAVTGLGGVGKTQLAVEFAHRYGRYFAGGVFWLSMSEAANASAEVAACGEALGLNRPGWDDLPLPEQAARVQREWAKDVPRLLIFDNCETEDILQAWLPPTGACRLLLTSRRATWPGEWGLAALPLAVLPRPQSIQLLQKYRPALSAAEADLLAQELGDLPLALQLAGSYLHEVTLTTVPDYLHALRKVAVLWHESLDRATQGYSPTQHDLSVGRTFALSYQQLRPDNATDQLAQTLLWRIAFLAPGEPVPLSLLEPLCSDQWATDEAAVAAGRVALGKALHRLEGLGLLTRLPQADQRQLSADVSLHRLLGVFVWAQVAQAQATAATQQAVEEQVLAEANRLNNAGDPRRLTLWQTHLQAVVDATQSQRTARTASLCNTLGYYLAAIGALAAARPYYEQALAIFQEVLGERAPNTALSLNNLGLLLYAQGELAAARPYLEQASAITREVLGERHPNTAVSLNNLGMLLYTQGELAAARLYYEQALAIKREVLTERDPETATSLNNFGMLLYTQGELVAARPYLEQALAITQEVLGEGHPDTATSLNNLGSLLQAQGELAAARPYLEQALAITREVLGEHHPDTAQSLNNLGSLLQAQGGLAEARPYFEQALAIQREVLGECHPNTAASLNNLGALLKEEGDVAGAKVYLAQALAICQAVLGADHPSTQTVRRNLQSLG